MHELITGFVFLGMVVAPALVAARSGKAETQPEESVEPEPGKKSAAQARAERANQIISPASKHIAPAAQLPAVFYDAPNLPVRPGSGMIGR